ncbi:hypothetical protein FB451DRAFT_483909 [Mycena latifolia]|nr:hypothetical protein FB451DRAFT_483909 [Mycena latifolia]
MPALILGKSRVPYRALRSGSWTIGLLQAVHGASSSDEVVGRTRAGYVFQASSIKFLAPSSAERSSGATTGCIGAKKSSLPAASELMHAEWEAMCSKALSHRVHRQTIAQTIIECRSVFKSEWASFTDGTPTTGKHLCTMITGTRQRCGRFFLTRPQ